MFFEIEDNFGFWRFALSVGGERGRAGKHERKKNSARWLARSTSPLGLCGFGLFDQGFLADDYYDARVGDVEAALIGFHVVADFGALR